MKTNPHNKKDRHSKTKTRQKASQYKGQTFK